MRYLIPLIALTLPVALAAAIVAAVYTADTGQPQRRTRRDPLPWLPTGGYTGNRPATSMRPPARIRTGVVERPTKHP